MTSQRVDPTAAVRDAARRTHVDVSVVVPVFNAAPYLRQCLDSVLSQSIGRSRLEVIAVDDGSTDGSAEILDEYAARYDEVRVTHQPNSGGPGRPRNVGIEQAAGTYVFFLDADDYLGHQALERLVTMADRNGSDIVLGKMAGVGGRLVPTRAFRRTQDRAALADVYSTLSTLKLFRRALIERIGARFPEAVSGGEDGPFTAELYLSAKTISVVADYDCYYCRDRPDSQTKRVRTESQLDYLTRMSERARLLARYRPPGPDRDVLMARHISDFVRPFNRRWLAQPPDERRRVFELGGALIRQWNTDRIQATLPPPQALRAYCLWHNLCTELEDIVRTPAAVAFGNPIVEGTRVFGRYPHFRDGSGIPDSCFEVTGRIAPRRSIDRAEIKRGRLQLAGKAYLAYVGGTATVVLRRWPWGRAHRFPAVMTATPGLRDHNATYPKAGFTADIELATAKSGQPLAPGSWQVRLAVGPGPLEREVPIRLPSSMGSAMGSVLDPRRNEAADVTLYLAADGSLRLRLRGGARWRIVAEWAVAQGERLWRRGRRRLSRAPAKLGRAWRIRRDPS